MGSSTEVPRPSADFYYRIALELFFDGTANYQRIGNQRADGRWQQTFWIDRCQERRCAWFTDGIFAEDRHIVELEQKAFDRQGADWNQEIFPIIQKLRGVLIRQGVPMNETGGGA